MRKVLYSFMILLTMMLMATLVTPVLADADPNVAVQIPVAAAWGSDNTASQTPLWYLYDNNPGTVWETQATTPASAWFVLKLAEPAVIDYLEIDGFQGGAQTAAIEFQD